MRQLWIDLASIQKSLGIECITDEALKELIDKRDVIDFDKIKKSIDLFNIESIDDLNRVVKSSIYNDDEIEQQEIIQQELENNLEEQYESFMEEIASRDSERRTYKDEEYRSPSEELDAEEAARRAAGLGAGAGAGAGAGVGAAVVF